VSVLYASGSAPCSRNVAKAGKNNLGISSVAGSTGATSPPAATGGEAPLPLGAPLAPAPFATGDAERKFGLEPVLSSGNTQNNQNKFVQEVFLHGRAISTKFTTSSAASVGHDHGALDEESFNRNLDQEARHTSNTHAVGQAHSIALTTQRFYIRLRVGRLLIVELQPHSPHKSPIHLRQPNLLVYEAVILERVLDVGPRQECLAKPR
jgi:hypothetical protein